MQSRPTFQPEIPARQQRGNVVRITPERLRAFLAKEGQHVVVEPLTDELAWEGTEIDVRRTVL
ncbi:hypothetical protein [Pelomonas cellulosilytica]|uniref:AbrB/MazE/SpoVT family DNA-binding domain-containing protein n=1 Tax=Pelomonas cellulosilytica TaxID=2906762 RepID=A0ABS8Y1A7_9BURK|nr:hypothetical protein [Pelomonas sp. P8]MCE4556857.1 hypothetical protein [Pelomonas sp. P8]